MGEFSAFRFDQGGPKEPREVPLAGTAEIIRRVILEKAIPLRELQRVGVITERTRRSFDDKLMSGRISISELKRLCEHLEIDMVRAMVAVLLLRNPMAYFETVCEVVAAYAEESSIAMHEQISAVSGDFGPIRRNLVQAHATKLTRDILDHQERALKAGEEAYLDAMTRGDRVIKR
jgi:hypothetical protein